MVSESVQEALSALRGLGSVDEMQALAKDREILIDLESIPEGLIERIKNLPFVLDATQSAETLGKNPSDADLEKSTYVSLYGIDDARHRKGCEWIDGRGRRSRIRSPLRRAGRRSEAQARRGPCRC